MQNIYISFGFHPFNWRLMVDSDKNYNFYTFYLGPFLLAIGGYFNVETYLARNKESV